MCQRSEPFQVWARLTEATSHIHLIGQEAEDLWRDFQPEFRKEIPVHWIALPTGFDLQVHMRFPGQPSKETPEGGLESALLGGYDSLLTMPNTNPFLDNPQILQESIAQMKVISGAYPVEVHFSCAATKGMQGLEAISLSAMKDAGAVAVTDDGWGVKNEEAQESIFQQIQELNLPFLQHAEMPGHKGVATASGFQRNHNLPEYPRLAESQMIERDLRLLRKYPRAHYHVLHVSTAESIASIRAAKKEGLRVTAEVTPHHLFFSSQEIPVESNPLSTAFKMNPPLFAPQDREALLEALVDGTIDFVSTDHAPHERENKAKGWLLSPFGTRGLETALSVLLTLVERKQLSLKRLEEVFSLDARKILPISKKPTGILFIDPSFSITIGREHLPGISENSCFLGQKLTGQWMLRCDKNAIFER